MQSKSTFFFIGNDTEALVYVEWTLYTCNYYLLINYTLAKIGIRTNTIETLIWVQLMIVLFLIVDLYVAPEIYKNEEFDRSVDAYSFGLILYEVFSYWPNP